MSARILGIDVGIRRGCSFAVLDSSSQIVEKGWLDLKSGDLASIATEIGRLRPDAIGIDAPRVSLDQPREWYWGRNEWRRRSDSERGHGRHCEVVVKATQLANPQWTPLAADAPEWMQLGFSIYEAMGAKVSCYEVFPTASYANLQDNDEPKVTLGFGAFRPGPKDILDSVVAALTVQEYVEGRGDEVGGGDGLGTIILPRPVSRAPAGVFEWPGG